MINEFLAKGNPGTPDFIELYNHTPSPLDVSGCILTDDPWLNRFVLPAGTTIAAGGFVVFDEAQLGFGLSRQGETLYLFNPDRTAVLDAVRFGPQAEGVLLGPVSQWERFGSPAGPSHSRKLQPEACCCQTS